MIALHPKLGAWVIGAALSVGAAANAAQVSYEISGHGHLANVVDVMGTPTPVDSLFVSSSSVLLEFDRDGNGVSGDLSLVYANLLTQDVQSFGALGYVELDQQILVNGAQGTLSGSDILWADSPATQLERVATLNCSGSICSSLGLNQGANTPPPEVPEARFGQSPALGHWRLSDDLSQILGSTRAVFTIGGDQPPPGPGEPAEWLVFGDADLGFVAEPPAGALLLMVFGAFGWRVRQRAATAR